MRKHQIRFFQNFKIDYLESDVNEWLDRYGFDHAKQKENFKIEKISFHPVEGEDWVNTSVMIHYSWDE